ncbi:MAG TPA: hypothetical protein VMW27_20060, partial [Thermoanaerobaculia bacterium]|nr:hypothetical protein [Thermoanaerobaculia bacterium]
MIRRDVTFVGQAGAFLLDAQPYYEDPQQEASVIASWTGKVLTYVESELAKGRKSLTVIPSPAGLPSYPAQAVETLIATTETRILDALGYPELAGLKDYAEEKLRKARGRLEASERIAMSPHGPAALVFASLKPPVEDRSVLPKDTVDTVLEEVASLIRRLIATTQKKPMLVSLCVLSEPEDRAQFVMHPSSYPDGRHEVVTQGTLLNVYPGLYVYQLEKKG